MTTKLFTALALGLSLYAGAQDCSMAASEIYQKQLNEEFLNPKESPLAPQDLKKFKVLDFYAIDTDFCVEAKLVRTPNEKPFKMATTTSRTAPHVKYGEVYFTLQGKEYKLDVFQNLDLIKEEKYKDLLFLPFTDLSSGQGSYAGGRYIDLKQTTAQTITIDFNTAYNPYCAYNPKYSCPIPPSQNYIDIQVKAGVKKYH
jgi:uncharacterized protein (DUF1684 family)